MLGEVPETHRESEPIIEVVEQTSEEQAENIVTEIRREENATEIINQVDSADFDLVKELVRKLEEQLSEIQKIDITERTGEAKLEMERMEKARELLKGRIENPS